MYVFLYNILAPILAESWIHPSLKALLLGSACTPLTSIVVCIVVWKHYQYKLWCFDLIRCCIPQSHPHHQRTGSWALTKIRLSLSLTCSWSIYSHMAAIVERGYNTTGFKVLSKDGQELDDEYLKRYKCVICNYLLRGASQLLCGDRICKSCFPSK